MEVELLLHGVPNGHDYYGPTEDQAYASTFYSLPSPFRERFHVEVRKSGTKLYCYYHYLLSGNIVAQEGRPGGYFGLAVRLDCYVKDPMAILHILETVFKTQVEGKILENIGNNLKYRHARFANDQSSISAIEKDLGYLLTYILQPNAITAITPQMCGSQQGIVVRNTKDTSPQDVLNCLNSCGKVVISAFAPSVSENEANKTIAANQKTIEDLQLQVKKAKRETEETKREVIDLCNKISKLTESANQQAVPYQMPTPQRGYYGTDYDDGPGVGKWFIGGFLLVLILIIIAYFLLDGNNILTQ